MTTCLILVAGGYLLSESSLERYKAHKSKDLVECRFSLNLVEQKTLDLAISKINPRSLDLNNPYRISSKEFEELGEVNKRHAEREMLKAIKRLRETTIIKHDPRMGILKGFGVISKFEFFYSKNQRSAQCDIWFEEELRDDLLAQKKFSEKELGICFKIRGKWTYKIYELMNQWVASGKCRYGYAEFREILGVPPNSYKNYSDFFRRILNPAIDEIDSVTDLHVRSDLKLVLDHEGKKVPGLIEFLIRKEPPRDIGESKKKKKGRKPKKEKESLTNLSDHLDRIFAKDLQEKLVELGVMHLSKLKDEGITEEIWKKTFEEEPSQEPRHLITTARRLVKTHSLSKKKQELDKKLGLIVDENKKWWDENGKNFDINGNSNGAYLQPDRGGVILFNDENFRDKVEKFRKGGNDEWDGDERREMKSLIGGTSERRKKKD
jgi:plasmid replication initiation protein